MERKMKETEIIRDYDRAVESGQIYLCYQPQFNHSTGKMVGAEALMRWKHPVYGSQSPADFIPVLENSGLIYSADLFIYETICQYLRRLLDSGVPAVPISFNISRFDMYQHDFVEEMEAIRKKYEVPVKYLRAEITESSPIGGMELVAHALKQLHDCGYVVEMDDFGCGYSSLNVLKDIPVDMIKLDMRFLSGDLNSRGGTIISAVVQMAKWLNTPTIAEGVETIEQADYMKSIGCSYIQGYLYSKPLPEDEFTALLKKTAQEETAPAMKLIQTMDAKKFWNPDSLETLIFSNYVGAAAIFSYEKGKTEILRINPKYLSELGMSGAEEEILQSNPWNPFSQNSREIYEKTIQKAIQSGGEETCDTWRTIYSRCCGEEKICVRSFIRVIGESGDQAILYAMVQNVTAEKRHFQDLYESERRFRFASEQANVYAWEYDVKTRQMRPCFRCMRDLGLPPLMENYPEPVIDAGVIPPDYADMYRAWIRELDEGKGERDEIIPFTVGRVPFHVRYTIERDENGKPVKAYGSATLVIDGDENTKKE